MITLSTLKIVLGNLKIKIITNFYSCLSYKLKCNFVV
nr:MAG TPA: hypothetical protein [Caudoviricetes sp.]